MAVELFSDNSGLSPRISFSHDLCLSDVVPIEQHPLRSNSSGGSLDFDFCVRKSFGQDSSSADELFSDGKILPTEIKKKGITNTTTTPPMKQKGRRNHQYSTSSTVHGLSGDVPSNDNEDNNSTKDHQSSKEIKNGGIIGSDHEGEEGGKQGSKSFWRFKRSSSLNCGSGYGGSLCPLPLLSRSNSTGSTPNNNVKRSSKDINNNNNNKQQQKQAFMIKSSSSSSSSSTSSCNNYQKPPLKKNNYGYYGNGVHQVNPVLNVPSGNLFGLGSIFFNGKDKNRKK